MQIYTASHKKTLIRSSTLSVLEGEGTKAPLFLNYCFPHDEAFSPMNIFWCWSELDNLKAGRSSKQFLWSHQYANVCWNSYQTVDPMWRSCRGWIPTTCLRSHGGHLDVIKGIVPTLGEYISNPALSTSMFAAYVFCTLLLFYELARHADCQTKRRKQQVAGLYVT